MQLASGIRLASSSAGSNPASLTPSSGVSAPSIEALQWPQWISGTVIVAVDLDAAGEIQNVTVVRSLGLGLDEKAKEAVRHWKFAPGTVDGKPAASRVEAAVTFRLL